MWCRKHFVFQVRGVVLSVYKCFFLDQKAISRYGRISGDVKWVYPYNLGWKQNMKQVLGSWDGRFVILYLSHFLNARP